MLGAIKGEVVGMRFEFYNTNKIDFELFTPDSDFTDDTICRTFLRIKTRLKYRWLIIDAIKKYKTLCIFAKISQINKCS